MSSEIKQEDIDFSRGEEDIAFVHTKLTSEIAEEEDPREALLKEMEQKGLEIKNARVIGIFRDEFSLLLEKNSEIHLEDEKNLAEMK